MSKVSPGQIFDDESFNTISSRWTKCRRFCESIDSDRSSLSNAKSGLAITILRQKFPVIGKGSVFHREFALNEKFLSVKVF